MKNKQIEEVILRSMTDEKFLDGLLVNPIETLKGFKLSDEEIKAISSGDEISLYEFWGASGNTGKVNAIRPTTYHHSQHKGIAGGRPDLLPRVVTE